MILGLALQSICLLALWGPLLSLSCPAPPNLFPGSAADGFNLSLLPPLSLQLRSLLTNMNLIRCVTETEFLSHCTRQQYQEKGEQSNNLTDLRFIKLYSKGISFQEQLNTVQAEKKFTYAVLCSKVPLPRENKTYICKIFSKKHYTASLYVPSEAFVQISFPIVPNQIEGNIFLRGVFVCLWSIVRECNDHKSYVLVSIIIFNLWH